ncbi:hypothetical protein K9L63_00665 [Candidatus Gracilibacteria bacterium]|nr:hypothetical protein [Candidatus Gracilibacteria bacterium]
MLNEHQIKQIGRGIYHITEGVGAPEAIIKPRKEEKMPDIKVVPYKALLDIRQCENGEPFVMGDAFSNLILLGDEAQKAGKLYPDYPDIVWLLREQVTMKLALAAGFIASKYPSLRLKLCEGYRPLEIQEKRFEEKLTVLRESGRIFANEEELFESAHQLTAVPHLAGHPTGGVVDVTIYNLENSQNLDMGTVIYAFSNPVELSWKAKNLTSTQKDNRLLLLDAMVQAGFAPYWGEWWHYSFGELEWAAYYDYRETFYSQVTTKKILERRK